MNMAQRREEILKLLQKQRYLSADDVAKTLNSSPATIRRDFTILEEMGKVEKYHGGIRFPSSLFSERNPLEIRLTINLDEKKQIAQMAASYIQDNDIIFIDASSTTAQMIPYIKAKNIQIFTHAYFLIPELIKYGFNPYLIGGNIHAGGYCYGSEVILKLSNIVFTKAFLGVAGINSKGYLVDSELIDCEIKKLGIENSKQSFCLATEDKFDNDSYFKIAHIDITNVITTKDNSLAKKFSNIIYTK
ncbi:DeoR/GlpR family DNA-binding transcription regulator [Thomasclavelia sp.]|uniref:DeoR/GlpR family DNA-binding transcription regulator n=1 Tax=Thomasclavelia sp. TaxID=3025757 RepID=UPI0025DEDA0F|nr:DeoR/GlpR family DNA-binding transcription regulator [Thomasclavelia sp.]